MTADETQASVRAAWEARPSITDAALRQGVYLPVPVSAFSPVQGNAPPTRSIQAHFFRMADDEVYQAESQHPYLLHRRIRIIGDGVTVEEQIEPSVEALKRGRYHQIQEG